MGTEVVFAPAHTVADDKLGPAIRRRFNARLRLKVSCKGAVDNERTNGSGSGW